MKQRIRRFDPVQVGKVLGVLYFLAGILIAPLFLIVAKLSPDEVAGGAGMGVGFAIAIPFFYGIAGFVFSALAAALYNLIAGWVGGIEVELEDAPTS